MPKPGVGVPVLSSVDKQWEALDGDNITGSDLEEGTKARSYKGRMSGIDSARSLRSARSRLRSKIPWRRNAEIDFLVKD